MRKRDIRKISPSESADVESILNNILVKRQATNQNVAVGTKAQAPPILDTLLKDLNPIQGNTTGQKVVRGIGHILTGGISYGIQAGGAILDSVISLFSSPEKNKDLLTELAPWVNPVTKVASELSPAYVEERKKHYEKSTDKFRPPEISEISNFSEQFSNEILMFYAKQAEYIYLAIKKRAEG